MSDLSQVERTEMKQAAARDSQHSPIDFRKGWIVGRDYGRERERALVQTLELIRDRPFPERNPDGDEQWAASVKLLATEALASLGEPEGQQDLDSGRKPLHEGPIHFRAPSAEGTFAFPTSQPDHGLGGRKDEHYLPPWFIAGG